MTAKLLAFLLPLGKDPSIISWWIFTHSHLPGVRYARFFHPFGIFNYYIMLSPWQRPLDHTFNICICICLLSICFQAFRLMGLGLRMLSYVRGEKRAGRQPFMDPFSPIKAKVRALQFTVLSAHFCTHLCTRSSKQTQQEQADTASTLTHAHIHPSTFTFTFGIFRLCHKIMSTHRVCTV